MVSETWFSEIESTIFTTLEYKLALASEAPYPDLNCTTSSQNESLDNVADFPTLYVHLLPLVVIGNDLENTTIKAVNATVELQVYSDKSEDHCRKIMTAAIMEMKQLHFNVPMLPDPQTSDKKYFAIARCNRVIGNGDTDIVIGEES